MELQFTQDQIVHLLSHAQLELTEESVKMEVRLQDLLVIANVSV
jgi:hypothetical protein